MAVTIGSARHDEHGACYSGGKAGDQLQAATPDFNGEVSQQSFYVHARGWHVLRPKSALHAKAIASKMVAACDNANIGYDQGNRLAIMADGISSRKATETDCSALVRACVKEATGVDAGNFTTLDEVAKLERTELFMPHFGYTANTVLCTGDILVTKTKGHTAIVTAGRDRMQSSTGKDLDLGALAELKKGSISQAVKSAQLLLNGKASAGLTVDGDFGDKTQLAVVAWQKAHGLTCDGIVGSKTWESLLTK